MQATQPGAHESFEQWCAHCGLPFPKGPVTATIEGTERNFCSEMCRDAYLEHLPEAPVYHGLDRLRAGVSGLDAQLPVGLPRNSFVMVPNEPGAQWEALAAELVWRTLQRDEPVLLVAFHESPISLVQQFLTFQWNVIPYLESGQLQIVDCFTYRVSSYDRTVSRFTDWNTYLHEATDGATTRLSDLDTMERVHSELDDLAEEHGMRGEGIVLIDSLYELGTLTQSIHAHNFVKDLRADFSKGRYVPVFGGASTATDNGQFPHTMTYLVDGLVELALWQQPSGQSFQKHVRVPQMHGVPTRPQWIQFEYDPGRGMVPFEPFDQHQP